MKKTLFAAALAGGVLAALPMVAGHAQDSNPPTPSATLPQEGGGSAMSGGPMMPMRHGWMHGRMANRNPQERCIDHLAWRAARRAFIETKLDLTAAQRPLWDKLESIAQTEAQKERQFCDTLKNTAAPTFVERMEREQQYLAVRLDALKTAQPAVAALYQALTPAQRAILDHPPHRG